MTTDNTPAPGTGAPIEFRKRYVIPNMCVPPDQLTRFEGVGPLAATLTFRNPQATDPQPYGVFGSTIQCVVTASHAPARRLTTLLTELAQGLAPTSVEPSAFIIMPWTNRPPDGGPAFYPDKIPSFVEDGLGAIEQGLDNAVTLLTGLLRWRCHVTGPINIPPATPLEWSLDGESWCPDPRRNVMPTIGPGPDLVVTAARQSDIETLLQRGDREPLHQSLLREAESLNPGNPRSALTIAVTSAEAAVKSLVGTLSPSSAWLVRHLPSPPIFRILEEYVPTLITDRKVIFPSALIKDLRAAINLRNELVHGARHDVGDEELRRSFDAIRDIVWLCDYFSGWPWAVNRVRPETLGQIGLTPTVPNAGWFVD